MADIDPRSGFCSATKTFHSLRPSIPLPAASLPLSAASYALSLLPSPLPSNPALISSSSAATIDYPQFIPQIRTLAASLRSVLRLSNGTVAFILSPASLDIPLLYFALLSLGAVVSPANPSSSPADIARMIRLSSPSIAFAATAASASKLPSDIPTVILDSPFFTSLKAPIAAPPSDPAVRQSDPAAILYSSGTTGPVKGVVITHRNLIAQVATFAAAAQAVQMLTVPLFHVYGFVFCVKAVAAGETAVIQTEPRFDARMMLRDVGRFKVTHLTVAPPTLLAMVKVKEKEGGQCDYDVSSLEAVAAGGAPVSVELIWRFVAAFPEVRLVQGYGLTESTAGVARLLGVEESRRVGSVGRLAPGCEVKIFDPVTGDALSMGMRGEIWVRGPTVMKGYIGDQEATSAILNSEGWLKTGDLGYIDNDGFLFVIDRLKELIKYKGYQVPPAELENLLQTHPNITDAAVIPYPHEEAGEVPMAFIVKQPHSTLNEAQIIEFIAKQVSPYKRIHRVSFVNSIPKNAAGKILRKDLIKLATSEISSKL